MLTRQIRSTLIANDGMEMIFFPQCHYIPSYQLDTANRCAVPLPASVGQKVRGATSRSQHCVCTCGITVVIANCPHIIAFRQDNPNVHMCPDPPSSPCEGSGSY